MQWQNHDGRISSSVFAFMWATLALITATVAASSSSAQDFQSWNEVDLAASYKALDFLVPLLARVDSSLPNPQLAATGITTDLRLSCHLSFMGGYLFAVLPDRSL